MAVYLGNNKITFDGISEIYVGSNKVYSATPVDYSTEYFFVENLTNSNNTLSIKKSNASAPTITVYRSVDKTTWVSMGDTDTTEITYTIPANSRVYLKATTNKWGTSSYYNSITCTNNYAVSGNIMSLIYGDNFIGQTVFPSSSTYNLSKIFYNSTYLRNIDNLVLPATTLTNSCYSNMFRGTSITSIPSTLLQATTLANNCYSQMFYGCTGLTSIPSTLLPATTLTTQCYSQMFYGCTSLTSIPQLPATTLANQCYAYMFNQCYGLTTVPSNFLPATTLASSCYQSMFRNCTRITTAPELPATTLASSCYSGMFQGCTGLTTAPELPATTLISSCYYGMFQGCTGLTTAPELPATTLTTSCYSLMFRNCSSLNEITCYANGISATNCTYQWVDGVAASGTFHKKGSASWTTGIDGIPTGWTVIDDSPYNPIDDYFWVENTSNASKQVCFNLVEVYKDSSWSSLQERYGSGTLYYSTNKTSWSTISTNTYTTIIYLTVPANTRYYLYMSWSTYGTTYSSFDYTYGGTANISGWGAYIVWGNYNGTGRCSSVFKPVNSSDNNVFAIGGNIRTITGSGQNGVSSTTQTYYNRSSYYKASSYTNVRYWTGLGKSTDSVISNQSQSGLYFQYIKDASQLYIGSTDVRPDFLNSGPNFVGPIYT